MARWCHDRPGRGTGTILGLLPYAAYGTLEERLEPGDRLVLGRPAS